MKISVITVCLNAEKTIKETIESVLAQTFDDFEYIIIDGASTDRTIDIVNSYSDSRIKVISEKDSGIYPAMNKGIKNSSGEYLFFLNANDKFFHSNVLSIFASKMARIDLLYGTYFMMDKKTGKYGLKRQSKISKFDVWQASPLQPTLFYKRELFNKLGFFNENFKICSDYDWSANALLNYNLEYKYIDTPITIFDTNGVSSEMSTTHIAERKLIDEKYFNRFELFLFKLLNTSKRRKIAYNPLFRKIFALKKEQ